MRHRSTRGPGIRHPARPARPSDNGVVQRNPPGPDRRRLDGKSQKIERSESNFFRRPRNDSRRRSSQGTEDAGRRQRHPSGPGCRALEARTRSVTPTRRDGRRRASSTATGHDRVPMDQDVATYPHSRFYPGVERSLGEARRAAAVARPPSWVGLGSAGAEGLALEQVAQPPRRGSPE